MQFPITRNITRGLSMLKLETKFCLYPTCGRHSLHSKTNDNESRKCVIPVVYVKLGKWYVVKHICVT